MHAIHLLLLFRLLTSHIDYPPPEHEVEKKFDLTAQNDFHFNGNTGCAEYSNIRWSFQADWQLGYTSDRGYEAELLAGHFIGDSQSLLPYIGVEWDNDDGIRAMAGICYTLPLEVVAELRVNTLGDVYLELEREDIPLTRQLRMDMKVNTDKEFAVALTYIVNSWLGISAMYNSQMKWGAGVRLFY